MMEQVFDREHGIVTYFDYDDVEDKVTIRQSMDVEPYIEEAKASFNEGLVNRQSEFRRIGVYPYGAIFAWARINKIQDWREIFAYGNEKLLERMVNDPDFSAFRTLPGKYTFPERS